MKIWLALHFYNYVLVNAQKPTLLSSFQLSMFVGKQYSFITSFISQVPSLSKANVNKHSSRSHSAAKKQYIFTTGVTGDLHFPLSSNLTMYIPCWASLCTPCPPTTHIVERFPVNVQHYTCTRCHESCFLSLCLPVFLSWSVFPVSWNASCLVAGRISLLGDRCSPAPVSHQ